MIIDKTKKKKRDDLINFLGRNRIGASVHYRSVTEMTYTKKNLILKILIFQIVIMLDKIQLVFHFTLI